MSKRRLPQHFPASVSQSPLDMLKGGGIVGGRQTEVREKEGKKCLWEQVYDRQTDMRRHRGLC